VLCSQKLCRLLLKKKGFAQSVSAAGLKFQPTATPEKTLAELYWGSQQVVLAVKNDRLRLLAVGACKRLMLGTTSSRKEAHIRRKEVRCVAELPSERTFV